VIGSRAVSRTTYLTLGLAYGAFLLIGMSSSLLGVAWPTMRADFALPLDAVGVLLIVSTTGFILASLTVSRLIVSFGVGKVLVGAALSAAAGYLGYALSPSWFFLLACSLLSGYGGGAIDASMNMYVASKHSVRTMNWMHACYGIGATLGPLMMTFFISGGLGWRSGYLVLAVLALVLAGAIVWSLPAWTRRAASPERTQNAPPPTHGDTRPERRPGLDPRTLLRARPGGWLRRSAGSLNGMIWLSMAIFFVYTGLEVSAGQWTYTLLTESRAVPATVAGLWTSVYWGSLTVGRIVLGALVERMGAQRLLHLCLAGVVAGCLGLWPANALVNGAALVLLGFSQAPLFPTLTAETRRRVGRERADSTIGLQLATTGLGASVVPALAGVFAARISLETLPPFLLVLAVILVAVYEAAELLVRRQAARQRSPA
jgi:fucose permease